MGFTCYTWVWIDGEDDNEGDSWIQISYPDGEEMAVVMCRDFETVKREHPEWIDQKQNAANQIVTALNRA